MWRCWCLVEIFSWCLVEILKMKCDQDLCLNFWYDLKNLLWQDELNPRVRFAFGNVLLYHIIFQTVSRISKILFLIVSSSTKTFFLNLVNYNHNWKLISMFSGLTGSISIWNWFWICQQIFKLLPPHTLK